MTDELKNASELLLNKTFVQKVTGFHNKVTMVSYKLPNSSEIRVTYFTLNKNSHTTPTMEYKEFLENHII
jgi:hypothetical protein